MLSDLWFRLRALFRRRAVEQELDDELRFHLDRQIDKHVKAGLTREEATRLARQELGGLEPIKEECREARGVAAIDGFVQDVRYGLRVLRRSPGFTAVAILTLTLGIGANTVLFSVVSGVLLHPLPYPAPHQLVRLSASKPNFPTGSISYPNFHDWRQMNRTFSAMAVSRSFSYTLTGKGDAEKVPAELVTSDFFPIFNAQPLLGRTFAPGEDEVGAAPVVIVGASLWKRKLGASPDAIGQTLFLDGKAFTIIGVMPPSLDVPLRSFRTSDVFVPIGQWTNTALLSRGAGLGIHGFGRLRPGVTVAEARADMDNVTQTLAAAYPDVNKGIGAAIIPLEQAMVGRVRPYLLLLLGAVGFVLLIACVNVANLLLARSVARSRELAIRRAVGASLGRLTRQLLTESVLLSLAGGGLGLIVAALGTQAVLQALPPTLPRAQTIGVDGSVLLYTTAISLLAGILFGLAPAISAARPRLGQALKEGGRGAGSTRHRAQSVFVVLEMALALVLLVGAGLMVRTLARLWSVDPGFEPRGVVSFGMSLSPSMRTASPETIRAALRQLDGALAAAPGVDAMSLSWGGLPMESDDEMLFWRADRPKPASQAEMSWTLKYVVGPGYLQTMRIPLLRGRFLTAQDDERAPDVVVIDDVLARTHFAGEDPIGKRLSFGEWDAEIVGVVGHVKQWGLDQDDTSTVRAQLYQSFPGLPDGAMGLLPSGVAVVVRYRGSTGAVLASIRDAVRGMGNENVIFEVRTLEEIITDTLSTRRFAMFLLGAFAVLALFLSSVGIYGVISYVVSQRTNEIGIRMALGARRRDVLALVLRQGAKMAVAGVAIGIVAALGLTRLMGDLLYGVQATDPLTFVGVGIGLTLVALAACYLPARRAVRVDPMLALRHE